MSTTATRTLLYRDEHNYKQVTEITFAGPVLASDLDRLRGALDEGLYLIPEQVGLTNPRDQFESLTDADHVWCELDVDDIEVDESGPAPTDPMGRTFAEFVREVEITEWDEASAVVEMFS